MQRQLALALAEDDQPLCQRCAKLPDVLDGGAVQLSWLIVDGIVIPELTETARYCRQCIQTTRVLFCPRCGKNDSLETTGDANACVDYGVAYVMVNRHCTR